MCALMPFRTGKGAWELGAGASAGKLLSVYTTLQWSGVSLFGLQGDVLDQPWPVCREGGLHDDALTVQVVLQVWSL